tara:strand:- start:51 stop:578 length:528 start_codon:yes stop_codon:yes gene_type:complete
MEAFNKMWDANPKSISFVMGVVLTLLLVAIIYYMSGENFRPGVGSWADEFALVHGAVDARNPAVRRNPRSNLGPQEHMRESDRIASTTPQSAIDPRFFPMQGEHMKDNDDKATELLQSRGGAYRAIGDGQRARYLGLAKLGGMDYEGYNWDGRPSNDENGLLNTQVWGINENRDF